MDITPWLIFDEDSLSFSFNLDRLHAFEQGVLDDASDLDAALSLANAIGELVETWEDEWDHEAGMRPSETALRVLQKACVRMGIDVDLTSGIGVRPGRRRAYRVWDILEPAHKQLLEYERQVLANELEESGWPIVDREVEELRKLWVPANSPAQYSAVGNQALRAIEAISDRLGDPQFPRIQSINRLTGVLDSASPKGQANEHLKSLVKDAVNLANAAKHDASPSRLKAGAAANAALSMVGIFRAAQ